MGKSQSIDAKKVSMPGKGIKNIEKDTNSDILKTVKTLESIDLSKNKITSIPASVLEHLTTNQALQNTLVHVDLSKNKLDNLPQEIFHCVNLQRLILKKNKIKVIPDALTYNLYRLEELDVSFNEIFEIPYDWSGMINLKSLNFENNKLTFLPIPIGRLRNLELLEVGDNNLEPIYNEFPQIDRCTKYIVSQKTMPKLYVEKRKKHHELVKTMTRNQNDTPKIKQFRKFLENPKGVQKLLEFMKAEFSAENLLFILSVFKFKAMYPSFNPIRCNALVLDATKIYNTYVSEDAPMQINISADVRDELVRCFATDIDNNMGIHQRVFDNALEQTIVGAGSDPFQRFLASTEGTAFTKDDSSESSSVTSSANSVRQRSMSQADLGRNWVLSAGWISESTSGEKSAKSKDKA